MQLAFRSGGRRMHEKQCWLDLRHLHVSSQSPVLLIRSSAPSDTSLCVVIVTNKRHFVCTPKPCKLHLFRADPGNLRNEMKAASTHHQEFCYGKNFGH